MSHDIPYAHPFPWTKEVKKNVTRSLRKRKFVGSGLALLRKESFGSKTKLGNVSRNILMNLFHQHGIELDREIESDENKFEGIGLSDRSRQIETNLDFEPGNESLFVSLLKVIADSSSGTISTRQIVRKVCPLLHPGSLPGSMDSKDAVLAALHFLSSQGETKSDRVLRLPLIRPVQTYGDLEKRNYDKVGDWRVEDIRMELLRMEEIFFSSPSSWKWQKRESLCLRLSRADEDFFFIKGTVPLCAIAKKVKGENFKKRKAQVKTTKTSLTC